MKGKILIVDDDPLILEFLGKKLMESGYVVETSPDGKEALRKIYDSEPSLIISDILMPNMDGYQLQQKLLDNPKTAKIPFIFLSVKNSPTDQLDGLRRGADDYLCKPPDVNDLFKTIDRVLTRSKKLRQPEADFTGNSALLDLSDLIQLIGLDNKSGTLQFKGPNGDAIGELVFDKGALIYAKSNDLEGEEAFYEIFALNDGFYEFYGGTSSVIPNITSKAMSILLDASRIVDESQRIEQFNIQAETVFSLNADTMPEAVRKKWNQKQLQEIFSLLKKAKTFDEILSLAHMSRLKTKAILAHLLKETIISVKKKDDFENVSHINPKIVKALKRIIKEESSGVLEVNGLEHRAAIFFQKGSIIHAYYGRTDSKKALYRIFAETGPDIQTVFDKHGISTETSISDSIAQLLKESQIEISGLRRLNKAVFSKKISLNYAAVETLELLKKNVLAKEVLSLVQQYGTVGDIIENSKQTDFEVCRQVLFLLKKNALIFSQKRTQNIQIITDTSADLPEEILSTYNIEIIPCRMLSKANELQNVLLETQKPDSSRQSKGLLSESEAFEKSYRDFSAENDLLMILSSSEVSTAVRSAQTAKESFLVAIEDRVPKSGNGTFSPVLEIIDSKTISAGLGLLVAEAFEKISADWPFNMLCQYLKSIIPMCQTFFIMDDIAQINAIWEPDDSVLTSESSKSGSVILTFSNGGFKALDNNEFTIDPKETVIEKTHEYFGNYEPGIIASISHSGEKDFAMHLKDLLMLNFSCKQIHVSSMGKLSYSVFGPKTVILSILPVIQDVSFSLT
jgi:CheY-like chemotaxis protein/fatty acid-binding protein DegV